MKKSEQKLINECCMIAYENAIEEMENEGIIDVKRLRSCSAVVIETDNYYILRSYSTIIAVIDKTFDTLYDVLRVVYGYTSTSSQHISKFDKDYCSGAWGCSKRLTAR